MADDDPLPALCRQITFLVNKLLYTFSEISEILDLQNLAIRNSDPDLTAHYADMIDSQLHSAQNIQKTLLAIENEFDVSTAALFPNGWKQVEDILERLHEKNDKNRTACNEEILRLKKGMSQNRKIFGNSNIFSSDIKKSSIYSEGF